MHGRQFRDGLLAERRPVEESRRRGVAPNMCLGELTA
jgi:hypothetical protein